MKKTLSVNLKHPTKRFNLGRYVIVQKAAEYDLNAAELKELEGAGPQKWLIIESDKKIKKSEK